MAICLVFKDTPIYNVVGGNKIGTAYEGQTYYSFGKWGDYIGITFNYAPFVGYVSSKDACIEENLMNITLKLKQDSIVYRGPSRKFASAGFIKRAGEEVNVLQYVNGFYRIGPLLWIPKSAFEISLFDWSLVLGGISVLVFGTIAYKLLKQK